MGKQVTQGTVLAGRDGFVVDSKFGQLHRWGERIGLQGLRIEKDKSLACTETYSSIRKLETAVRGEFLGVGNPDQEIVDLILDRIVA